MKQADEKCLTPNGVKLHLGCGREYWTGYLNVDRDPATEADIVSDFSKIDDFIDSGSVAEVCMIHSLSYLNLWQARDLFRMLHRLMVNGGRLIIESPDIVKCAKHLIKKSECLTEYLEGVRGIYAFDFEQISQRALYTPYAFGWTGQHLQIELRQAGFAKIRIMPPRTHGHPWRDIRVEAVKPHADSI